VLESPELLRPAGVCREGVTLIEGLLEQLSSSFTGRAEDHHFHHVPLRVFWLPTSTRSSTHCEAMLRAVWRS
jgi:hypothetical protein